MEASDQNLENTPSLHTEAFKKVANKFFNFGFIANRIISNTPENVFNYTTLNLTVNQGTKTYEIEADEDEIDVNRMDGDAQASFYISEDGFYEIDKGSINPEEKVLPHVDEPRKLTEDEVISLLGDIVEGTPDIVAMEEDREARQIFGKDLVFWAKEHDKLPFDLPFPKNL